MSRQKKRNMQSRAARLQPILEDEHIPANDRLVLEEQPGQPLERGGIYSEMGADLTYEELTSFPSTSGGWTNFEQSESEKPDLFGTTEMVGSILMILGIFIMFISPFWLSIMTLGIALIAKRYHSKIIFTTAVCFTVVSFIFALYSMFY